MVHDWSCAGKTVDGWEDAPGAVVTSARMDDVLARIEDLETVVGPVCSPGPFESRTSLERTPQ
jgi:hypothetical protein